MAQYHQNQDLIHSFSTSSSSSSRMALGIVSSVNMSLNVSRNCRLWQNNVSSCTMPKSTAISMNLLHGYCSSSIASKTKFKIGRPTRLVTLAKVSKGSVPPDFKLKDQNGKTVSLSNFKGKPLVVYFYPADETPGCTKEACAFRDSYEKFKRAGAEVIGISGDSPESHKAFASKYRLPFILLSDEGNKVRKQWGVPGDFFGSLPGRETYVLDRKGLVQLVYNNQFQPEKHVDETLNVLKTI